MINVNLGTDFLFTVGMINKAGRVLTGVPFPGPVTADTDDHAIGTVTVNADGTGGDLTGVAEGGANLQLASGPLTGTFAFTVADNTPVGLVVIPS